MVKNFVSLCDDFISSMNHRIVHCFPLIYLFITYQFYQLNLNTYLYRSVISLNQNIIDASSVTHADFRNSAYMILKPFSSVVTYLIYRYGSMQANNSAIIYQTLNAWCHWCHMFAINLLGYLLFPRNSNPCNKSRIKKPDPLLIRLVMLCINYSSKGSGACNMLIPYPLCIHIFSLWGLLDKI